MNSTTKLIKNRMGNSAHIDEVELEALDELMDHPIDHVIHEINMFSFSETGVKQISPVTSLSHVMTPGSTTRKLKQTLVFMKSIPPPMAMIPEQFSPYKSMAGQSEPYWILVQKGVV